MTDDDLDMPPVTHSEFDREPLIAEPVRQVPRFNLRNKKLVFILSGLVLGAGSALWLTIANSGGRVERESKPASTQKASGKVFDRASSANASHDVSASGCANGAMPVPVKSSDGVPITTSDGQISICPDGSIVSQPFPQSGHPETGVAAQISDDLPTFAGSNPSPPARRSSPGASLTTVATPVSDPLLLTSDDKVNTKRAQPSGEPEAPFLPISAAAASTDSIRATRLQARDYLLPEGRMIECALSVRLVSELAGKAVCVLTRAVYSDTGRVRLLEQGSEVLGEYRSLSGPGHTRLMVQWTRIRSPSGVVVRLQADSTDPLGSAGLEGNVQSHWWTRIGSAFLLSSVQDVIAGASSQSSSGEIVLRNTTTTSRTMAEKVLDQNINIPPTFYRRQGDRALIYVNRDVDFQDVYSAVAR